MQCVSVWGGGGVEDEQQQIDDCTGQRGMSR